VIAKNDWSATTGALSGFHNLHCESASASAMNGQVSKSQSDIHLESAHDSAALVHEGNIMKRVELGCGTQAPATKSRAMLGATKLAQNSALGNTFMLMRVIRVFANLPAPQVLQAAADTAPANGDTVPAGQGVQTAAVVAPVTFE
jgi:hypothetical protein